MPLTTLPDLPRNGRYFLWDGDYSNGNTFWSHIVCPDGATISVNGSRIQFNDPRSARYLSTRFLSSYSPFPCHWLEVTESGYVQFLSRFTEDPGHPREVIPSNEFIREGGPFVFEPPCAKAKRNPATKIGAPKHKLP